MTQGSHLCLLPVALGVGLYRYKLFTLCSPEAVLCVRVAWPTANRLLSRSGDVSDATVDLLKGQQAAFEGFTEEEQSLVIRLDTSQDWKSQLLKEAVME